MLGARKLLSDKGFASFNMRNLAAQSGVGLGTIYDYFSAAKDILHVLLVERHEARREIFTATLEEVSSEQGLAVFVPAYLQRLAEEGFWSEFDNQLREAVKSDDDLARLFASQEDQFANHYLAEMQHAGSQWSEAALLHVARANMAISEMVAELPSDDLGQSAGALKIQLSAAMISANLKMVMRPQSPDLEKSIH